MLKITTFAFSAVTLLAAASPAGATTAFDNAVVMCRTEVQSYSPQFSAYVAANDGNLVYTRGSVQERYAFFSCMTNLGIPMTLGPVRY
jgi:hypothetical protein